MVDDKGKVVWGSFSRGQRICTSLMAVDAVKAADLNGL